MKRLVQAFTLMIAIALVTVGVASADAFDLFGKDYYLNKNYGMKASGTSYMDFSGASGMFNTSTGANYFNGAASFASTVGITSTLSLTGKLALNGSTLTTDYTVLGDDGNLFRMDASGANVTLTLPDAANVADMPFIVQVSGNPGGNYARINATGGDDIDGNNYYVSTDQYSSVTLISDGTNYFTLSPAGTWTQHA